jgi:HTH-type transcriptional regulator / antitoxin HipB
MQLGKDQFSIAEKAGISRAWLVALEKGKSGVSVGVVLRVLSALGLQMSISDEEVKQLRLSVPSKMKRVDLNALLGAWKKKHDQ